jgi:hypothetical protein
LVSSETNTPSIGFNNSLNLKETLKDIAQEVKSNSKFQQELSEKQPSVSTPTKTKEQNDNNNSQDI